MGDDRMLELRGMRAFSLSAAWDANGISFDAQGVFVGGVPLFKNAYLDNGHSALTVRPVAELNGELTARYRLPIDASSKLRSLALVAKALNRGDLAMAAIVAVQMQFPNPPFLAKGTETADELMRRALELRCSRLLKANWNPAQHPRAETPPNPGWFAPIGTEPVTASPVLAAAPRGFWPWQKPEILEGGGGGGVPRGTLELPFPRGLPRFLSPGGSSPKAPSGSSSTPPPAVEPQPTLPFPGGLPPKLAPYVPGGKTSGIFQAPNNVTIELESGYEGPAASMRGSSGFDGITLAHVEGHAAALMREQGIAEGTLYINNPEICASCTHLLPKMLSPGARLRVVLPDGTVKEFRGVGP
jgi:nucleic acid/nucleotide deaminase of polymorphic system toxin